MTQQNMVSPFRVDQADFDRWSKQRKALYLALSDGRIHRREALVQATGALNITAVVSELRHKGAVIDCTRNKQQIYYQLKAMVNGSTVQKGIHCETCRCAK